MPHTPGPWRFVAANEHNDADMVCRSGDWAVLFRSPPWGKRADITLIAAAPDLLAALETALAKMPFGANWDANGNNPQWVKDAHAAIAKALGI